MSSISGATGEEECRLERLALEVRCAATLLVEIGRHVMAGFQRAPWGGREVGGVLFGRHDGKCVQILAHRPVECEHAEGPAFQLSPNDEEGLRRLLDAAAASPGASAPEVVGWYRSEYNDMNVLPADQRLHDRFFPAPWQIAAVFRRIKGQPTAVGIFARDAEQRLCLQGSFTIDTESGKVVAPASGPPGEPSGGTQSAPAVPREDPFPARLGAALVRASRQHRDMLARLLWGIENRKGLILLTAETGMGKTALLEALGDELNRRAVEFAMLKSAPRTPDLFFQMINYDLALPCQGAKAEVLFALTEFASARAARGSTTVAIIDDAHEMSREVIAELAFLDNLQSRREKLIQVVLAARPEWEARLDKPEFRAFKMQIGQRCSLRPFDEPETGEYIAQCLASARGHEQEIFSPDAVQEVHRMTRGVPALINAACRGARS